MSNKNNPEENKRGRSEEERNGFREEYYEDRISHRSEQKGENGFYEAASRQRSPSEIKEVRQGSEKGPEDRE